MLNLVEKHKSFKGYQEIYNHLSSSNKCKMNFALYRPDNYKNVPIVYFLSGITCTEQNFIQKSSFQKFASAYEIVVVVPDTSPRGKDVPDDEDYKLGQGAGFFLNATEKPWSNNYNMYDYICFELPKLINENFDFSKTQIGIFGHSMGGGGAIQCAIKNKNLYKSVSAFSPICSLYKSDFAKKATHKYLMNKSDLIDLYDPIYLLKNNENLRNLKIDVGLNDEFLKDLYINDFEKVCESQNQNLVINKHIGYNHGYYFIQSFIESHFNFHSEILK